MAEIAADEHFGVLRKIGVRAKRAAVTQRDLAGLPVIGVQIGDAYRKALDWTVGGFRLDEPIASLRMNDVRNARIAVLIGDFDVRFALPVQVAAASSLGATHFTFLGAFTEQARLLHRLVEDSRAGHTTRFETLLASPPAKWRESTSRRLIDRLAVVSLVAAAAVLALVVATSLLTVRSRMAAVTMEGSVLRAPATGLIVDSEHAVGSRVRKDQPLFRVIEPALAIRAAEASAELKRLDVVLDQTRMRFAEIKNVARSHERLSQQKLEALRSRIAALDSQISIYARLVDKKQLLAGIGAGSNVSADVEQIKLESRRQERQLAEEAHATALAESDLLRSGILSLDRRAGSDTVENLRLQVAEVEMVIDRTQATINAIRNAGLVGSPCDCEVYALMARSGEIVEDGMPVIVVRALQGVPIIEALFDAEDIGGVTVGSAVSVSLAGRRLSGRLENLTFDDHPRPRIGLVPASRTAKAKAQEPLGAVKATISLAEPTSAAPVGTPGEVAIVTSPLRRTLNRIAALGVAL